MRRWLAFCLLFFLTACEPEATPFPIEIPPTPTPVPPASTPEPVRYALAPNTQDVVADLDAIRASAQIEQLTEDVNPAELDIRFDVVVSYGAVPGWSQTDPVPTVAIAIASLDDPQLESVLRNSIDSQRIVDTIGIEGATVITTTSVTSEELRTELANLGRPDGFSVIVGHAFVPGAVQMTEQLEAINIDTRLQAMSRDRLFEALTDGEIQMALLTWMRPEQREQWTNAVGEANVIDLYTLPVSYLAVPELTLSFTSGGFPLVER